MKNSIIINKNDSFEVQNLKTSLGEIQYSSIKYPHHEVNQDSLAIFELENGDLVLVVSDGMGGHAGGEQASKIVCETFKKQLKKKTKKLREKVIDALEKANQEVQKLKIGAGATLSCCYIKKNGNVRFFNIGDSSQILLGSRGKIKYRGIEHSPLGHGIEAGLIENRIDQDVVESNIVSNGIGFPDMRIEMSGLIEMSDGDLILIATDGIIELKKEDELVQWIVGGEYSERVPSLIEKFKTGETAIADDSTLILFKRILPPVKPVVAE